jgi:hypothetical protein
MNERSETYSLQPEQRPEPTLLLRSARHRAGGPWPEDDYDVLHEGYAIGRIYRQQPGRNRWIWSVCDGLGPHDIPGGITMTRNDAMASFKEAWQRRLSKKR